LSIFLEVFNFILRRQFEKFRFFSTSAKIFSARRSPSPERSEGRGRDKSSMVVFVRKS